jgi:hypothetical protein
LIMVQPCCSFEDTNTDSLASVSSCWWFGSSIYGDIIINVDI